MAPVENLIRLVARSWVSLASRGATLVVLVAVCVTAGLGFYAATNAGINTDTSEMLDRRLPFRQLIEKSREAFPQFGKTILIVLDSEVSGATDAAASDLSKALREKGAAIQSVFYPADDPFFRKNGFLYLKTGALEDLTDRLTAAQPFLGTLARDPSLRGFVEILAPALQQEAERLQTNAGASGSEVNATSSAEMRQILSQLADTVIALANDKPGLFPWQEILTSDRKTTRAVILVQPQLDFASLSPAKAAMAEIREIAGALELEQRGVTLRLTGAAALSQEELKSVESNIGLVGLLSLVFVGLLLFVGMRSPAIAIAVLFTLICGLVWTGAFAVAVFGSLNLISVAFAVLFIGLGVDFGIHFGLRAKQAVDAGSGIRAALSEAGHDVGFALALTTVMAAIGFLSFLPTDYRGLSQLGVISAGGMVIAFIGTLTLCPAILALLPPKATGNTPQSARTRPRLRLRDKHSGVIVAAAVAVGLSTLPIAAKIQFDFDPMNLRDQDSESVTAFRDLMLDPNTNPYQAEVLATDLAEADIIAKRLSTLPTVKTARTLSNYVPTDQDEKLAILDDAGFFLLPALSPPDQADAPTDFQRQEAYVDLRKAISEIGWQRGETGSDLVEEALKLDRALDMLTADAQTLQRLEARIVGRLPNFLGRLADGLSPDSVTLDTLPTVLKERLVAVDGTARLEIFPAVDVSDADEIRRFVAEVDRIANGVSGTPAIILAARDAVLSSFVEAAWIALLSISLLLVLLLRSILDALFVLAPMALAVVFTGATAVLAGLSLNFANVIVLPLLLGLGVASGIHLVVRGRHIASSEALRQSSTPRAVMFSALTTIASFGTLAMSTHPGTASMGLLLTIAISYTLLCTLIVLPALLNLRRQWQVSHQ